MKKECKILIIDSSPIISLAKSNNLHIFLAAGLPVYVPLSILLETTSKFFPVKDEKEVEYIERFILKKTKRIETKSCLEMKKYGDKLIELITEVNILNKMKKYINNDYEKQENIDEIIDDISKTKRMIRQRGDMAIFEAISILEKEERKKENEKGRKEITPVYIITSDKDVIRIRENIKEFLLDEMIEGFSPSFIEAVSKAHVTSIETFLISLKNFNIITKEKEREILDKMKEMNRPDTSKMKTIEASGGSIFKIGRL